MIWHIVRKDGKLLWRMVAGVALVNTLQRAIVSGLNPFRDTRPPLGPLLSMFDTASILATALLVVMAVQRDPIPGYPQDWLVRPIRRRDLMLAKLVFVALFVQGPIFLLELCQCLAAGFPLRQSLAAPLEHSLWMLFALDLPVLAFATLTKGLRQAAGSAIAIFVAYAVFAVLLTEINPDATFPSGVWLSEAAQVLWGLLAVAVVLALQYYRRKTATARWIFGAAILVWVSLQFVQWRPAFAIEERLSKQPAAASPIQVAFDPSFGKFQLPPGVRKPLRANHAGFMRVVPIWLPLRIGGLGANVILVQDQASARLIVPGGRSTDLGPAGAATIYSADHQQGHEPLWVPEDLYNGLKDRSLDLEFNWSLTLLEQNTEHVIPAVSADVRVDGLGRCDTRSRPSGTAVELTCITPGKPPFATWFRRDKRTGEQISDARSTQQDYAPFLDRVMGDSISRFGSELPASRLPAADAEIVLRSYSPVVHFTRRLVISQIRLSEWQPE